MLSCKAVYQSIADPNAQNARDYISKRQAACDCAMAGNHEQIGVQKTYPTQTKQPQSCIPAVSKAAATDACTHCITI